jgi:geranylgeranyl reductase family protein
MEVVDVAIVGAGPAGATCAAFCAAAGLRVLVIERENFPREKVCGDTLNPACWPVLRGLDLSERVRSLPHVRLDVVDFIAIGDPSVRVRLSRDDDPEIAIKRSLFDELLLNRARELGAFFRGGAVVSGVDKTRWGDWKLDIVNDTVRCHALVAADGRNSTIARLRNLLPKPARERVALQSHVPLPNDFGNRVVLQLLPEGYSGQAPVNERELNVCLVGRPQSIGKLKTWAERRFDVSANHPWRTVTPLTRPPIEPVRNNLFFIGDAARVVEPFTGEGIYYALRSGELAAAALKTVIREPDGAAAAVATFARAYARMYRGRLWVNQLARAAVLSPRIASIFVRAARRHPSLLRALTAKVTRTP